MTDGPNGQDILVTSVDTQAYKSRQLRKRLGYEVKYPLDNGGPRESGTASRGVDASVLGDAKPEVVACGAKSTSARIGYS